MKGHYKVNGIDYFVLNTARDSESFMEFVVLTDSFDVYHDRHGIVGSVYVASKASFEKYFSRNVHSLPCLPSLNGFTPGVYEHYKHHHYSVIGLAKDIFSFQESILYKLRYEDNKFGHGSWILRPREEFFGDVILPDSKIVPRFRLIL